MLNNQSRPGFVSRTGSDVMSNSNESLSFLQHLQYLPNLEFSQTSFESKKVKFVKKQNIDSEIYKLIMSSNRQHKLDYLTQSEKLRLQNPNIMEILNARQNI